VENFIDLVKARHSVRRYLDKPVTREQITACLESAHLAPSGENIQPWRFIVVDEPGLKQRLVGESCSGIYRPTRFIRKAPMIVVVLAEKSFIVHTVGSALQGTQYYLLDIGMACEHLVLRAREMGIGSCYIGWFSAKGAARALNLSGKDKVVMLISLGYPDENQEPPRKRKPLEEVIRFNEPF